MMVIAGGNTGKRIFSELIFQGETIFLPFSIFLLTVSIN